MSEQTKDSLDFHHVESAGFRTTYASGVVASLSLNGMVNLTFYIDRAPTPDLITYKIDGNKIGAETNRIVRSGVLRELQQGILVDVQTATNIIKVLQQMIDMHKSSAEQVAEHPTKSK
jgi:hypothetical protein